MNQPGEFLLGPCQTGPYRMSLNRTPHLAFSMATGRGKSTMLRCSTAQLMAQDPLNHATCVDTKRTSLIDFKDQPWLTLHNDPMDKAAMAGAFRQVHELMRARYADFSGSGARQFPLELFIWEEANDLATELPQDIWPKYAAPILRQGREVNIHVIGVFQDFTDNCWGGVPIRPAFEVIGMSGWRPQVWDRVIGTKPVPRPQAGAGRILVCEGESHTWVQALKAESDELIRFVHQSRERKLAA